MSLMAGSEIGKDGIVILRNNNTAGIQTPLTDVCRDEILKQSNTTCMNEALEVYGND